MSPLINLQDPDINNKASSLWCFAESDSHHAEIG